MIEFAISWNILLVYPVGFTYGVSKVAAFQPLIFFSSLVGRVLIQTQQQSSNVVVGEKALLKKSASYIQKLASVFSLVRFLLCLAGLSV